MKKPGLAILGIVVTLLPGWAATLAQESGLLEEGLRLLEERRFDDALVVFDQFKQSDPTALRGYLYSGQALVGAGRLKDASIELDEGLRYAPSSAIEALSLARLLDRLNASQLALSTLAPFEDDLQLPADGVWLLVDLHFRARQFDEALRVIEKYQKRYPYDSQRATLKRGDIQFFAGNLEKSMVAFEEVVQKDPTSAEGFFGLARITYVGNNHESARKMAQRAVELDPENGTYYHLLGQACLALDLLPEAIQHLRLAAELEPLRTQVLFDLGQAYRRSGDSSRARQTLADYQQKYAAEEEGRNQDQLLVQLVNQGQRQVESGEVVEALRSFQRALELDPDVWEAHRALGQIYLSSGRSREARVHLQKLMELDSESSEAHFLQAFLWFQEKDYEKALAAGLTACRLRPGHAELRNLLGNIYFERGELEEALQEYGAATRIAPDRLAFQTNYETVVRRLGRVPR